MKIVAFTPWSSMVGGANRSFFMVIERLKTVYKHEILVVVPNEGELTDRLTEIDVPYKIYKSRIVGVVCKGEWKDVLRKIKSSLYSIIEKHEANGLTSQLENWNFDIAYINCINIFLGFFTAKKLQIPFVWHLRGALTEKNYFSYNQEKIFNDSDGCLIAISNSMKQAITKILKVNDSNVTMIHNGIGLSDSIKSKQYIDNKLELLICGRICTAKNQLETIKAVNILIKSGMPVHLNVAGIAPGGDNDPYLNTLKDFCELNNLVEHVSFLGQVTEMPKLRAECNIEIISSICEPFGRVTIEAMHAGLVVVGANTGGTLDIIQDGYNGFMYKQGQSEDLAKKIMYIANNWDYAKQIANNGFEFSQTHFTVEENVRNINILLTEVKDKYVCKGKR